MFVSHTSPFGYLESSLKRLSILSVAYYNQFLLASFEGLIGDGRLEKVLCSAIFLTKEILENICL